jgi:hypothetical protein
VTGPIPELRHQRDERVVWRYAADSVVLLPPGATDPILLGGTGQDLWVLLAEPITLTTIIDALAQAYGMPSESIAADVTSVVEMLRALGALADVALAA